MKRRLLQLLVFGILLGGLGWQMNRNSAVREVKTDAAAPEGVPFADIPLLDRTAVLGKSEPADLPALAGEAELRAKMSRSTAGLVVVTRPDGSRSVNLGGRFTMFSATVNEPDGAPKVQCFSSVDELKSAISRDPQSITQAASPVHATR